jgi:hypothetical protein
MNLLTFAANRSSFKKNVLKTREEFEDFVVKSDSHNSVRTWAPF